MDSARHKRSLVIIWITIFIDLMGITLIIPFINDLVADLGGDEQIVGLLLASYAAMQLIFAPLWGRISDRIGRRPVIIIGLATSTVAFTIFGLATHIWLLFASRMLAGFANANISTAQAYVADITPPAERAGRMGLVGAAFNLGFIVGFPIGGIMSTLYGNAAPAYFAAALSAVNFVAALFILPESRKPDHSAGRLSISPKAALRVLGSSAANIGEFWRQPALGRVLTAFFLFTIAFSVLHVTFVEYGRDILRATPQERGFVFMWIGVVGALTQSLAVKRLVRRMGEDNVIRLGLACMAIGLASIPYLQTMALLYAGAFFVAVGNSLVTPAVTAVISMRSDEREQGVAMGVTQSTGSLGRILGPPFGGVTYARIGYRFPFLAAAAMALLSLLLYRKIKGEE
ncbi:MAG: MFS transporter [Candidatus Marinimicrobia bacterium]|nr:MFS transporter [Candidatus Neomarinimicrobiota bacterium]